MHRTLVGVTMMASFLQFLAGCHVASPADRMIARVDAAPADQRPPEWDRTKALMLRRTPKLGEPAPNFTLALMNSEETVTLAEYRTGQPKVLIFGSFT